MTLSDFTVIYVIAMAHFLILLFLMRATDSVTSKIIDNLRDEMNAHARQTNVEINKLRREMDALRSKLDARSRQRNARINNQQIHETPRV